MTNAVVNLWSLMVGVEGKSVSQSENATEVVKLASAKAGFGTELDLEVTEHGTWKIRVYNHYEDNDDSVEFSVDKYGRVTVSRDRSVDGIGDSRKVSF
jgi:hypothetical protein